LETFEIKPANLKEEYYAFLMDIISQIVKLRIDKGLTQKELAHLAGLKQTSVSKFENLDTIPSLKFLFKLLKSLNGKIEITSK